MKKPYWLVILTALSLLLGLGAAQRSTQDVLTEAVVLHGCYGRAADEKVERLLTELDVLDAPRARLWRGILDYWDWVNTDMTVNTATMPDDLPRDDSLCIIVLGYALNDDGTMAPELLGRLRAALACSMQYPDAWVLCTGGGTAAKAPGITEGRAMGDWLLAHGLDPDKLIVEDRSMTTAENAQDSCRILLSDYPSVDSAVIVSSSYHVPWGALLFEAAFRSTAFERQRREIHVIANVASPAENAAYAENELLRWQAGGMLQLLGREDLANEFYYRFDEFEKPELEG